MSKTTALRIEIQRILKTLTNNVHYADRPDNLLYPCMVYELNELVSNYGKTTYQFEINILDYGTKTTVAETLADETQDKLHKYYFYDNNKNIQFVIYKGARNIIREEDKKIIRRRLLFELQLYEMKGE